jgi:hypothetical protein
MHDRLTTQLIRLPPEKAKSKNAPKHVEAFVCGSIPNGPRLKSAVDMLYVCARERGNTFVRVRVLEHELGEGRRLRESGMRKRTTPPKVRPTVTLAEQGYE